MKNYIWGLVAIIILAGVIWWVSTAPRSENTVDNTDTENGDELQINEYTNADMGISSLEYPDYMTVQENDPNNASFRYLGPTQSLGTEVYDGIIINMDAEEYTPPFDAFVRAEVQSQVDDQISEIVEPLREVELGGTTGYTLTLRGLGEFDIYYLPVTTPDGTDKLLRISMLVADPTNAGFQDVADMMLESLSLLSLQLEQPL